MTKRNSKSMSISVKSRLLNLSRQQHEEFNLLLIRYGIERLLYRISRTDHRNSFVLKGAILFHLFTEAPHRATKDVDLLGVGSPDPARMESCFREIVKVPVIDDGLQFDADSVHATRIKEGRDYEGIRVSMLVHLGSARIQLHVDIGFGDAITPRPKKHRLPCILDFEKPEMAVYPWETVVAEKFQAVVAFGMTNSRMKDFYDLYFTAREMSFDGLVLSQAIRATFERRNTILPLQTPLLLLMSS